MEPIPETVDAIDELDPAVDDGTLLDQLNRMADRARTVVPDLVGMSVASSDHDVTFTLVATDEEVAALDAVQYLASGPCVDAFAAQRGIYTTAADLMDEGEWRMFSQATAAAGVRSTVTFPVVQEGAVVGTVNLYAAGTDSFSDRHEALAAAVGGWAPGAVANADLSFSTRRAAERAPDRLRDQALLDAAAAIVAVDHGLSVDEARERLEEAAIRAGVPLENLARTIVHLYEDGAA